MLGCAANVLTAAAAAKDTIFKIKKLEKRDPFIFNTNEKGRYFGE